MNGMILIPSQGEAEPPEAGHVIGALGLILFLLAFLVGITRMKVKQDRRRKESDEWFT